MNKLPKEENTKLEEWVNSLDENGQLEVGLIIEGFEKMPEDMSEELNLLYRLLAAKRYEATKESPVALMFAAYACGFYRGAEVEMKILNSGE